MKLITKNTDYAIRALSYMVKDKEGITTVSELNSVLQIPRPFLRKILQTLQKGGILKSYKGKRGGFQLALSADDIRLLQIVEIFQGPERMPDCQVQGKPCPEIRTCILKTKLCELQHHVVQELKKITLSNLIR